MFNQLLRYCRRTGNLHWMETRHNAVRKGVKAGYSDSEGYWRVYFMGKAYLAHRVVWHMHHGSFPNGEIDHINGKRQDNRIENLRDVPKYVNLGNSHKHRKGKLVGCSFDKRRGTWKAKIVVRKKELYLGAFKTELQAHKAYLRAVKKHY